MLRSCRCRSSNKMLYAIRPRQVDSSVVILKHRKPYNRSRRASHVEYGSSIVGLSRGYRVTATLSHLIFLIHEVMCLTDSPFPKYSYRPMACRYLDL